MSVAEMKLAAIAQIGQLKTEAGLKEILIHLAKLTEEANRPFDTDKFFQEMSVKYDDVLKRLAQ